MADGVDEMDYNALDPAPKRTWRVRFSILSMLLITAIVAISVSHWQTSQQLWQERHERRVIDAALGIPTVTQPEKLTVMSVPMMAEDSWEWHLVIPPKQRYEVFGLFQNIPSEGMPANGERLGVLEPGSMRLNVSAVRRQHGGVIRVASQRIDPPGDPPIEVAKVMKEDDFRWIHSYMGEYGWAYTGTDHDPKNERWFMTSNEGLTALKGARQVTFGVDEIVLLRRARSYRMKNSTDMVPPTISGGFMLWLEPITEPKEADHASE